MAKAIRSYSIRKSAMAVAIPVALALALDIIL